jgi:hypothetical protein
LLKEKILCTYFWTHMHNLVQWYARLILIIVYGLKDIYTISVLFMSLFELMHPMDQLWWFIVHFLMGWKKGTWICSSSAIILLQMHHFHVMTYDHQLRTLGWLWWSLNQWDAHWTPELQWSKWTWKKLSMLSLK